MVDFPGVLMTVSLPENPTLGAAADALHVQRADLDASFGLVVVDPDHSLYAVKVLDPSRAPAASEGDDAYHGPFSNPRISPMDLTGSGRKS